VIMRTLFTLAPGPSHVSLDWDGTARSPFPTGTSMQAPCHHGVQSTSERRAANDVPDATRFAASLKSAFELPTAHVPRLPFQLVESPLRSSFIAWRMTARIVPTSR